MNKILVAALSAVVAVSSASASAATPSQGVTGHWEWRPAPQFGPRSTPGQRREWVADAAPETACACPTMKHAPKACMSMKDEKVG